MTKEVDKLKFFMLIPDGCADWPIKSLGGKTPLEASDIKHINSLAKRAQIGMVKTISDGIDPGSDAANLSILGYAPQKYLTGRAPLEAAAAGLPMGEGDFAFRTNLVKLSGSGDYGDLIMEDHSAGEIPDEAAREIIELIDRELGKDGLKFHPGISYRATLITDKLNALEKITPPHDILGRRIGDYLPKDKEILRLMTESYKILEGKQANSIWLWGQGRKTVLPAIYDKYSVQGTMISAVNLLKGIGVSAGMKCPNVVGATGTKHTNYAGKAECAIESFRAGDDFVFLHVEAPDECAHCGDLEGKVWSLGQIDGKIFAPVYTYLKNCGEPYRILILPDHRTPMELRTHTAEPVPFVLYDSERPEPPDESKAFSEASGATGKFFSSGAELAEWFFLA